MLPECKLSVLDNLSPYIRRLAKNVCSPRPSTTVFRDMEKMIQELDHCHNDDVKLFLPVAYAVIDPARLPTEEYYDPTMGPLETAVYIHIAIRLLPALGRNLVMTLSPEIAAEMWPRFWALALFLDRNHSFLTHIPAAERSETLLYTTFLTIVGGFCHHPTIKIQVFASPDILLVSAKGWKHIHEFRWEKVTDMMWCYGHMHDLLVDRFVVPSDLTPFIPALLEGTGGTFVDLADVMIRHFKSTTHAMSREEDVSFPGHGGAVRTRGPLCAIWTALLSRGIVPVVLRIVGTICDTGIAYQEANTTLKLALFVLAEILVTASGSVHLPDAIRCGLIHSIIKISATAVEAGLRDDLKEFLIDIIPANLHRFGVLAALADKMGELNKLSAADKFRLGASQCLYAWIAIQAPLKDRLSVYEKYCSENRPKLKNCANMKCGRICDKYDLKCCSGCKTFFYCSRECQKKDWHGGGHRDACAAYGSAHSDAYGTNLSVREISFLRFQMDHDLAKARSQVVAKQASSIATGEEMTMVRFNYGLWNAGGLDAVTIDVLPYREIEAQLGGRAASWTNLVSRAEKSEGRTELHVARVCVVDRHCERYVPLPWCTSQPLRPELEKIVFEQSASFRNWEAPVMVKKYNKLLAARAKDVIEFH
ncbi:hypothetical protein C8F01DRAFT_1174031 [Mycena amicta]|nr:hypothetical protein C8F01DRAFT_1174031 [Mycena amicta]